MDSGLHLFACGLCRLDLGFAWLVGVLPQRAGEKGFFSPLHALAVVFPPCKSVDLRGGQLVEAVRDMLDGVGDLLRGVRRGGDLVPLGGGQVRLHALQNDLFVGHGVNLLCFSCGSSRRGRVDGAGLLCGATLLEYPAAVSRPRRRSRGSKARQ